MKYCKHTTNARLVALNAIDLLVYWCEIGLQKR